MTIAKLHEPMNKASQNFVTDLRFVDFFDAETNIYMGSLKWNRDASSRVIVRTPNGVSEEGLPQCKIREASLSFSSLFLYDPIFKDEVEYQRLYVKATREEIEDEKTDWLTKQFWVDFVGDVDPANLKKEDVSIILSNRFYATPRQIKEAVKKIFSPLGKRFQIVNSKVVIGNAVVMDAIVDFSGVKGVPESGYLVRFCTHKSSVDGSIIMDGLGIDLAERLRSAYVAFLNSIEKYGYSFDQLVDEFKRIDCEK